MNEQNVYSPMQFAVKLGTTTSHKLYENMNNTRLQSSGVLYFIASWTGTNI
jgi:hypothetical protein